MKINNRDVPTITSKEFLHLLTEGDNLLVYGNSGLGKTSLVKKYCLTRKKKLKIVNLATKMPEAIGGIPHVSEDKQYYTELLNKELAPMFEDEGRGWVLFFDEIGQAPAEVLNTLYGICNVFGEDREWCGHSLRYAQIVACNNLSDGSDNTVYLTELPGPLCERFFVFELVASDDDTMEYLSGKYSDLPFVSQYIQTMQEEHIAPRNIEKCLKVIKENKDPLKLQAVLQPALTAKVLNIKNRVKDIDPSELLKNARLIYAEFQKKGFVDFGTDRITTKTALKKKLAEFLTEEEIASIMNKEKKGGE